MKNLYKTLCKNPIKKNLHKALYIYIHIYIYTYMCMYIYIYIERERENPIYVNPI